MSKLIVGDEKYDGKITIGHNVNIGYYAQNQAEILDGSKTVFQTIDDEAVGEIRKNVRTLLGSFLFGGDDIDKKVRVLSGGEKGRLAMCKLLLQPYSLLVLDEPTNHLDIRSKEVLKNALMDYNGTLVIVSHDRDFLQGLTNRVFEFRNGNIKQHIGDVNEYLQSRKIESFTELEKGGKKKEQSPAVAKVNEVYDEKKQKEKERNQLQNHIEKCEKEVAKLEQQIKAVDDKLLDPEQYQIIVSNKDIFSNYEAMKKKLDEEMRRWEAAQMQFNSIGKD